MKKLIPALLLLQLCLTLYTEHIHDITKTGDLASLRTYLTNHPEEYDLADERGSTPLHFACDLGYLEIVKFLLPLGADINKRDVDGDTPLIWAIARNRYEVVEYLLAQEADVNVVNNSGFCPIFWAIYRADVNMLGLLLENGADINAVDYEGRNVLHVAGITQKVEAARFLINKGIDLEKRETRGRTPLILTAREHGNLEIIKYLVKKGAEINAADNYGGTALELTAWRGYEESVNYLLAAGATLPEEKEKQLLIAGYSCSNALEKLFAKFNSEGIIQKILENTEKNLLVDAAKGGSVEITDNLIKAGFDPAGYDFYGWTPLHYAAASGHTEVVQTIIEKGVDPDLRNFMGETACNIAGAQKHDQVVAYLKTIQADTSAVKFPELKGDYMGATLSGSEPQVFSRGIVSSHHFHHDPVAFSPAGDLAVWPNNKPIPGTGYTEGDLYYSRKINDVWSYPQPMPFTSTIEEGEPFFSADGSRLYFMSRRTTPEGGERTKENIWYVEILDNGFSAPVYFDETVNSNEMHWQFSFDAQQNCYFGSSQNAGFGQNDIYLCRVTDGKYEAAENLGNVINSEAAEFNPIISQAGDILIFTRAGSNSDGLFISVKKEDDNWSHPHPMRDITLPNSLGALFSPDEKYLFFLARENNAQAIYWVKIDDYIANLKMKIR